MNFFNLDPSLETAVFDPGKGAGIRLEIETEENYFVSAGEIEVDDALFTSYFDSSGGILSRAYIRFEKTDDIPEIKTPEGRVKILFTAGETERYLHRFTMYPDDRGFIEISEGNKRRWEVYLEDFPVRLKRKGAFRDWSEGEVFTDIKFSDKADPENSLIHRIAAKGGVEADEIDCCTVNLIMKYVKFSGEPWEELCSLSRGSFALIEGGTDKKLLFSESPYLTGDGETLESAVLDAFLFYRIEKENADDLFFNSIRLKWRKPERLERQVLWRYSDPPVFYDEELKASYPFKVTGEKRDIESEDIPYYAIYVASLPDGSQAKVVYTDMLDNISDVRDGILSDNPGGIEVSGYDELSFHDRALIKLKPLSDTDLYDISISGRPVVYLENFSCYRSDNNSIAENGLRVFNLSGKYLSDDIVGDKPHYEEWTERMLFLRNRKRRRFSLKSEYSLFHARVGAKVILRGIGDENINCSLVFLEMRLNKGGKFRVFMRLNEEFEF